MTQPNTEAVDACAEAIASIGRDAEESDYIEKLRTEGPAAK